VPGSWPRSALAFPTRLTRIDARKPATYNLPGPLSTGAAAQQGSDQSTNIIHGKAGITLPAPPPVKSSPVRDEYKTENSGAPVKVTDNYRWLENANAPNTRTFIYPLLDMLR
jgi:hypothetical protein